MSVADITIIGGGPAGCLLACELADMGKTVEIHEKRPDLRVHRTQEGRSINLALSERGLQALRRVSLENPVLEIAMPMYRRIIHLPGGGSKSSNYGTTGTEAINSVSRAELNRMLLDAAQSRSGIRLHFNSECVAYDAELRTVILRDRTTGADRTVDTQTVIGTDGSASAIRDQLKSQARLKVTSDRLSHGYKELVIPAAPGGQFRIENNGLHIWPRKSFMLIALPNIDGSFTCTLFLEKHGEVSFESLPDGEAVHAFFAEHFPDTLDLIPDLRQDFFKNPLGHLDTVMCAPWHYQDRACLLGDAAHAIIPFYGQGLNCALQDVAKYVEAVSAHGGNLAQAHQVFFEGRKPDADAIAQLARGNFVEMRDRVSDPKFLMKKDLEHLLEELFPTRFMSTYGRVTFNTGSYAEALRLHEIQEAILYEACAGVTSVHEIHFESVVEKIERAILEHNRRFTPDARTLEISGDSGRPREQGLPA